MVRGTIRFPAAVLLVLVLVVPLAGCGDDESAAPPTSRADMPATPEVAPGSEAADALQFDKAWWSRRPAVRILLVGGQRGTLKPCGCSRPQLGGLERMAAVLHQLRRHAQDAGGHVAALGIGWSLRGSGEAQEEAKADFLRAVYESLGFSAVLLGAPDLLVPAMGQPRGTGVEAPRPPLNVYLGPGHAASETRTPFADLRLGGMKVRAFSVIDPERAEALEEGGQIEREIAISHALGGLSPQPDTLWIVAMDARSEEGTRSVTSALTRLGPGIVADVSGGGAGGSLRLDRVPLAAGRPPLVVDVGEWGKAVGVLDLDPAPAVPGQAQAGWLVSYRRIDLVPQWEKVGRGLTADVSALERVYREMVKSRGYLRDFPRDADGVSRYVGSGACATCHAAIYKDWKRTGHAVALETLTRIDRDWDPECIRCHVVGWKRAGPATWLVTRSAFRTPDRTPFLGGVGCENCHGPGAQHVADPYQTGFFDGKGPGVSRPEKAGTCVACHDLENSHGFLETYATSYLPEIDHHLVPSDLMTIVPKGWKPRK